MAYRPEGECRTLIISFIMVKKIIHFIKIYSSIFMFFN